MPAIGMCGTFDVENFGDLLFPLLAQHELSARLPDCALRCFAYSAKEVPAWPFAVHPVAALKTELTHLDAVLIGGGHVIRFDKALAPGYHPPSPELHHPLSLWLIPALMAARRGLPLAWNAVAALGRVPEWARPLVATALRGSAYVGVRDEHTRTALAEVAPEVAIERVPDTAFGIGALLGRERPSAAVRELQRDAGFSTPYIVLQATQGLSDLIRTIVRHVPPEMRFLALPIGPVLGDADEEIRAAAPQAVSLPRWPHPLVLAELIAGAQGVVGTSLHLGIVAASCGVPVFRPRQAEDMKYAIIDGIANVHAIDATQTVDAAWLRERLGPRAPDANMAAMHAAVRRHWDRVADVLCRARTTASSVDDLLLQLPRALELAARRLEQQTQHSVAAEQSVVDLRGVVAAVHGSASWRMTQPLRRIAAALRPAPPPAAPKLNGHAEAPLPRPVLRTAAIRNGTLAVAPYRWARVDRLYTLSDAAALSATFPRDRFKPVQGYDGEKSYAYHARALIHMGRDDIADAPGLSAAWRRFAEDLLTPEYRAAMSELTGIDLMHQPLEANAFHYGPGAWLGPHVDLADKIATHVLYFNGAWDPGDGGCLAILRSSDIADIETIVAPVVGSSAVLVRSEHSWHAVTRVDPSCRASRRSVTVTFYREGSVSTMWPPGEAAPTADYADGA